MSRPAWDLLHESIRMWHYIRTFGGKIPHRRGRALDGKRLKDLANRHSKESIKELVANFVTLCENDPTKGFYNWSARRVAADIVNEE